MKKLVRVISVLTLTLCMGLALTACAKENGTYVYSVGEGTSKMAITLELKNGKYTATFDMGGETGTEKGTYKIKGDKFTAKTEDGEITGTIKPGKEIVMDYMGVSITLKYKK